MAFNERQIGGVRGLIMNGTGRAGRRTRDGRAHGGLLQGAVCILGFLVAAGAWADEVEMRQSTSAQYQGGRDAASERVVTEDRYRPLVTAGERGRPAMPQGSSKTGSSSLQSLNRDFWIYLADVILFGDDDEDGYFYGIDLLFDADTIFAKADVYAVLYLSLEGGPWNEYHVTDTFRIFGATSDDEYVVVTELESGYPRGSYDLLIELYDTFDGSFVASLGPVDTSALAFLPLEDFRRDEPSFPPPVSHSHSHGGGAMNLVVLGILACFTALAVVRRRAQLRYAAGAADRWVARMARDPGADRRGGLRERCALPQGGDYAAGAGVAARRAVCITLRPQAERESKQA